MSGIIVLDKPRGIGSNRAMSRLKRLLGVRKMGFLGTLDPLASGVLPVFVGQATRLIPAFEGADKDYEVTLRLGEATDTYDADGTVLARADTAGLTPQSVQAAVESFSGEQRQVAPAYSAVKHAGVPAYTLARQGKPVPLRERTVRLRVGSVDCSALPEVRFAVHCSSGAYMRSLAHDIGRRLGVGGHVTALRRTRCGEWFSLAQSITLETLAERAARQDFAFLLNPAELLQDYRALIVEAAQEQALRQGRAIPLHPLAEGALPGAQAVAPLQKMKAIRSCGTLVAIGEVVAGQRGDLGFQPRRVLA
ncbi:MAG: tRNA pseudouridine(55) synthase TruB [Candidatus Lambdaproteobacteria bacterium]|nr:tRNA pseudouridine(55) synthase TruB [Candidatus Lambdaproteobacteria bacterium]